MSLLSQALLSEDFDPQAFVRDCMVPSTGGSASDRARGLSRGGMGDRELIEDNEDNEDFGSPGSPGLGLAGNAGSSSVERELSLLNKTAEEIDEAVKRLLLQDDGKRLLSAASSSGGGSRSGGSSDAASPSSTSLSSRVEKAAAAAQSLKSTTGWLAQDVVSPFHELTRQAATMRGVVSALDSCRRLQSFFVTVRKLRLLMGDEETVIDSARLARAAPLLASAGEALMESATNAASISNIAVVQREQPFLKRCARLLLQQGYKLLSKSTLSLNTADVETAAKVLSEVGVLPLATRKVMLGTIAYQALATMKEALDVRSVALNAQSSATISFSAAGPAAHVAKAPLSGALDSTSNASKSEAAENEDVASSLLSLSSEASSAGRGAVADEQTLFASQHVGPSSLARQGPSLSAFLSSSHSQAAATYSAHNAQGTAPASTAMIPLAPPAQGSAASWRGCFWGALESACGDNAARVIVQAWNLCTALMSNQAELPSSKSGKVESLAQQVVETLFPSGSSSYVGQPDNGDNEDESPPSSGFSVSSSSSAIDAASTILRKLFWWPLTKALRHEVDALLSSDLNLFVRNSLVEGFPRFYASLVESGYGRARRTASARVASASPSASAAAMALFDVGMPSSRLVWAVSPLLRLYLAKSLARMTTEPLALMFGGSSSSASSSSQPTALSASGASSGSSAQAATVAASALGLSTPSLASLSAGQRFLLGCFTPPQEFDRFMTLPASSAGEPPSSLSTNSFVRALQSELTAASSASASVAPQPSEAVSSASALVAAVSKGAATSIKMLCVRAENSVVASSSAALVAVSPAFTPTAAQRYAVVLSCRLGSDVFSAVTRLVVNLCGSSQQTADLALAREAAKLMNWAASGGDDGAASSSLSAAARFSFRGLPLAAAPRRYPFSGSPEEALVRRFYRHPLQLLPLTAALLPLQAPSPSASEAAITQILAIEEAARVADGSQAESDDEVVASLAALGPAAKLSSLYLLGSGQALEKLEERVDQILLPWLSALMKPFERCILRIHETVFTSASPSSSASPSEYASTLEKMASSVSSEQLSLLSPGTSAPPSSFALEASCRALLASRLMSFWVRHCCLAVFPINRAAAALKAEGAPAKPSDEAATGVAAEAPAKSNDPWEAARERLVLDAALVENAAAIILGRKKLAIAGGPSDGSGAADDAAASALMTQAGSVANLLVSRSHAELRAVRPLLHLEPSELLEAASSVGFTAAAASPAPRASKLQSLLRAVRPANVLLYCFGRAFGSSKTVAPWATSRFIDLGVKRAAAVFGSSAVSKGSTSSPLFSILAFSEHIDRRAEKSFGEVASLLSGPASLEALEETGGEPGPSRLWSSSFYSLSAVALASSALRRGQMASATAGLSRLAAAGPAGADEAVLAAFEEAIASSTAEGESKALSPQSFLRAGRALLDL